MEDVVEFYSFPMFWELQTISDRSEYFCNGERSFSLCLNLLVVSEVQVLRVQPDFLSFQECVMNAFTDLSICLSLSYLIFFLSYHLFCRHLIVVALLLTLPFFVLFYAALRSRSLVRFLMLRTPQHSVVLYHGYLILLTRYDSN